MIIKINSKEYDLPEGTTLQEALDTAAVKPEGIATAVNNCVVPAPMRPTRTLSAGDEIVIIKAFYGG